MSILGQCKLPLIRLRRSCFLCPLYVKVGSLTDCPLRKYHRAFDAYEKRTGETHPLVLKRTHSNESRFSSTNLTFSTNFTQTFTNFSDMVWTLEATVGTPGVSFSSESPFRVAQTSKLITKCAVKMDTFSPAIHTSVVLLARPALDTTSTILPLVQPLRTCINRPHWTISMVQSLAKLYPIRLVLAAPMLVTMHTDLKRAS
jgi:hypothetical protein